MLAKMKPSKPFSTYKLLLNTFAVYEMEADASRAQTPEIPPGPDPGAMLISAFIFGT